MDSQSAAKVASGLGASHFCSLRGHGEACLPVEEVRPSVIFQARPDGEEMVGADPCPMASRLLETLADCLPSRAFGHAGAGLDAAPDTLVVPHAALALPAVVDACRHIRIPAPARLRPGDDVVRLSGPQVGPDLLVAPLPLGGVRRQRSPARATDPGRTRPSVLKEAPGRRCGSTALRRGARQSPRRRAAPSCAPAAQGARRSRAGRSARRRLRCPCPGRAVLLPAFHALAPEPRGRFAGRLRAMLEGGHRDADPRKVPGRPRGRRETAGGSRPGGDLAPEDPFPVAPAGDADAPARPDDRRMQLRILRRQLRQTPDRVRAEAFRRPVVPFHACLSRSARPDHGKAAAPPDVPARAGRALEGTGSCPVARNTQKPRSRQAAARNSQRPGNSTDGHSGEDRIRPDNKGTFHLRHSALPLAGSCGRCAGHGRCGGTARPDRFRQLSCAVRRGQPPPSRIRQGAGHVFRVMIGADCRRAPGRINVHLRDSRGNGGIDRGCMADAALRTGNGAMISAHLSDRNIESMLRGTLLATGLISLILLLVFRSIRVGLACLVPDLVPAAMTLACGDAFPASSDSAHPRPTPSASSWTTPFISSPNV